MLGRPFSGVIAAPFLPMHEGGDIDWPGLDGVQSGDFAAARRIWSQLGPIARYCWRPPIRDFRPRMKEVLRMQGHIASAACREPQLGVGSDERAEIARLMRKQGLL